MILSDQDVLELMRSLRSTYVARFNSALNRMMARSGQDICLKYKAWLSAVIYSSSRFMRYSPVSGSSIKVPCAPV